MRAAACLVVGAAALAVGCGSGVKTRIVTADGRIGNLRVDRSDARAVVAFAGRPDAARTGTEFGSDAYRALGYDCAAAASAASFPLLERGPYCRTVFFVNARTGRVGSFYTSSPAYAESDGVRIGMATADAERLLHRHVHPGCASDVYLGALTIDFRGGAVRKTPGTTALRLVGGHVDAFAIHGRDDVGVFDCLD